MKFKRLYQNKKWFEFSDIVQKRDGYKCLKCNRKKGQVSLQTHHLVYKYGLEVWNYPYSDCITLCKGCHAIEHRLIEPSDGWTLIAIYDLTEQTGICQANGCGKSIRYEHLIYRPNYGFKIVGSTCVHYLTRDEIFFSENLLSLYKNISHFVSSSVWKINFTKYKTPFFVTTHSHHQIRIYGSENYFSFQVAIKKKGKKFFNYKDFVKVHNKSLDSVKELAYIALLGTLSDNDYHIDILRNLYRNIL